MIEVTDLGQPRPAPQPEAQAQPEPPAPRPLNRAERRRMAKQARLAAKRGKALRLKT
jgi:hypothetical protein